MRKKKKQIQFLILLLSLLYFHTALALDLERPVIVNSDQGKLIAWGQFDLFDAKMDVLKYRERFNPQAARLDYVKTLKLGTRYSFTDELSLAYSIHFQSQHTTRSVEPKILKSQVTTHQLRGQWTFFEKATPARSFKVALEAGFRINQANKSDFYKLDVGTLQISWPGHALFSLDAGDQAYLSALRAQYTSDKWRISTGLELRYVRVFAFMDSQNATVNRLLQPQIPQLTPWHETHVILQFSADYYVSSTWQITFDFQHYDINRHQYTPKANKQDYNTNDTLDVYLLWKGTESLKPYVHGQLSRRFTLGDMPLAYNQRSNDKFKYPFGYVSVGIQYFF